MSRYKTFGNTGDNNMGFAEQYHPQNQRTPIQNLDFEPQRGGGMMQNAVQDFARREPQFMQQPQQVEYPPQPQFVYQQQPLFDPRELMQQVDCRMIANHVEQCVLCSRIYRQNNNQYISLIVILSMIIIFLLTRIIK